jgi:hypothetical protein
MTGKPEVGVKWSVVERKAGHHRNVFSAEAVVLRAGLSSAAAAVAGRRLAPPFLHIRTITIRGYENDRMGKMRFECAAIGRPLPHRNTTLVCCPLVEGCQGANQRGQDVECTKTVGLRKILLLCHHFLSAFEFEPERRD